VALVVVIYLGVRLVLMMVTFALARRHWVAGPPQHRLGIAGELGVFLGEYLVSLAVFSVLQPCRRWFDRNEPAPAAEPSAIPVLLVHGFVCNGAVWWAMRRYLAARGVVDVHTITLEPVINDIDSYAAQLAARVEAILSSSGAGQLILVAHSMGGLVARAYVEHLDGADKVAGLVTLGTPHHGTALGSLLRGRNLLQMRRGSSWLRDLNAASEASPSVPVTTILTWHDNVVVPQPTARLEGARNIEVSGMGHLTMLFRGPCQALVLEEINALRSGVVTSQ
jgi:pimeloyl-ACP methyl ester carboxylesterase